MLSIFRWLRICQRGRGCDEFIRVGEFILGEEMLLRSCFDSLLVILAFVIDDVEDFLPFLDLLFHFLLAAKEKFETFLKRAVAFVDPFGELADFLDGKPCALEALDDLERGEVDVGEAAVSRLGPFEEGEKAFLVIITERRRRDARHFGNLLDGI